MIPGLVGALSTLALRLRRLALLVAQVRWWEVLVDLNEPQTALDPGDESGSNQLGGDGLGVGDIGGAAGVDGAQYPVVPVSPRARMNQGEVVPARWVGQGIEHGPVSERVVGAHPRHGAPLSSKVTRSLVVTIRPAAPRLAGRFTFRP